MPSKEEISNRYEDRYHTIPGPDSWKELPEYEWYRRLMNPTLADVIRENLGMGLMFIFVGLCYIYGHDRIEKLLDRLHGISCDAQGNFIYPQE